MWNIKRTGPFLLLAGLYVLAFYIVPWLNASGLGDTIFFKAGQETTYYNIFSWDLCVMEAWIALFYLSQRRFRGDQFYSILASVGVFLVANTATTLLSRENTVFDSAGFWPILCAVSALSVFYFYRKRYLNKSQKTDRDSLKLYLVLAFVLLSIFTQLMWMAGFQNLFFQNYGLLSTLASLVILAFFFVHFQYLHGKSTDDYVKLAS